MRKVMMMAAGLVGVALVSGGGATPASAGGYDYPWCVQGRGIGYPGDCSYHTFEQCRASASGRSAGCGINPRACILLGSSQMRIEYWPAPNTTTLPTPGRRAISSLSLMVA